MKVPNYLSNKKLYGEDDYHETIPMTVSKHEIEDEFRLPKYNFFRPKGKEDEECAWAKLGKWVLEQRNDPENTAQLSVSNVIVSPQTYEVLSKYTYYWLFYRKATYLQLAHDRKKRSQFGFLSLDISPACSNSDFIKDDYVYIRKA